ncbi:MAG TPA: M20/M25/M40 family metallo-hydrolase [Thermoanaerobaculia bacterium]|nr:M20/M25/M40 family metallo-hydrolase [Thermoanaerobaculia bacterium]
MLRTLEGLLPDALFAGTLAFLTELTAVSSPSGDAAGLHRMADLLGETLARRGMAPEVKEERGEGGAALPILLARGSGTARGHLLFVGHLDTVLPAAPPAVQGDRLLATGAIDMKGGFATLVGALDLLAHRGVEPPADLLLVAVPDEEVGGEISRRAVRTWGEKARAVWVLEPGEHAVEDGGETMVAGRRGMFNWRLDVRGRAAHSGVHYWDGRSALAAAARWCAAAQDLSEAGGGPTVNCGRLVAGDAGFVDGLATAYALLGSERQLNIVPDRAVAEGEGRFLRAAEGPALARQLGDLAADIAAFTGTEAAFTAGPAIPPVDPGGPQFAWCERAVALAAARGWRLEVETERGGISFPNFLPDPGRVPVLDGLGPAGGGMHTRAEWVDLRSLRRRIVLLADLLAADAGASRLL